MSDSEPSAQPARLTADEYHLLAEIGVLDKIELLEGRVVTGDDHDVVFSPAQARIAARHGVQVWSAVAAVLADDVARAEIAERLRNG